MIYGQLYLDMEAFSKKLKLKHRSPDGIDRIEKNNYTATSYIWSYPNTLSYKEAIVQFFDATISDIDKRIYELMLHRQEVIALKQNSVKDKE